MTQNSTSCLPTTAFYPDTPVQVFEGVGELLQMCGIQADPKALGMVPCLAMVKSALLRLQFEADSLKGLIPHL